MRRLYRYVGTRDVAEAVRGLSSGHRVGAAEELAAAVEALGGEDWLTVTFVVDALGVLRVADRSSEHVACAGHGPVLAAGELGIADGEVVEASNQSTGFCPEPECFGALARALDDAAIPRVDAWTAAFDFRRCDGCGGRTLIKDGELECAECGGALPERWNFERTLVRRAVLDGWVLDVIEEPGDADQDRVGFRASDTGVVLALADGAGGTSHGAETAERAVDALSSARLERPDQAASALRGLDVLLASQALGECTAVLARVTHDGSVVGASAGDSVAWVRRDGVWAELTEAQRRKPLIGSGRAVPVAFGADADAVLIASDGLAKAVPWPKLAAELDDPEAPWRLADLARLPSGRLADDLSALWLRRVRASARQPQSCDRVSFGSNEGPS